MIVANRVSQLSKRGQSQAGFVRERFFAPRLRVKSSRRALDKCIAYAKAHRHSSRMQIRVNRLHSLTFWLLLTEELDREETPRSRPATRIALEASHRNNTY